MVCYNPSTMSNILAPVDISNMPDLLDLVEEVEATKTPRELMRDSPPHTFFLLNDDMELNRNRQFLV